MQDKDQISKSNIFLCLIALTWNIYTGQGSNQQVKRLYCSSLPHLPSWIRTTFILAAIELVWPLGPRHKRKFGTCNSTPTLRSQSTTSQWEQETHSLPHLVTNSSGTKKRLWTMNRHIFASLLFIWLLWCDEADSCLSSWCGVNFWARFPAS